MTRAILTAYSQPTTPDQESEFNRWYDEVHIPQILQQIPEVKSATRYKLSATQAVSQDECPQRRYLTIYEVDADNLSAFKDRFFKALSDGSLDPSEAIDLVKLRPLSHFYEPAR